MASNSKKRLLRRLIYLVLGIAVIAAVVWRFTSAPKTSPYVTSKVEKGNVSQTVALSGTVEPMRRYQLQFARSGRIENVNVQVGSVVKANDLLASLEKKDLELQLKAQKAALQVTQANLNKVTAGPQQEDLNLGQLRVMSAQASEQALLVSQQNALNLAQRSVEAAALEMQKSQLALQQAEINYYNLLQNGTMMAQQSALPSAQNLFYNVVQSLPNEGPFQNTITSVDQYFQQSNQQAEFQRAQQIQEAQRAIDLARLNYQQAQGNLSRAQFQLQQQLDELHANQVQATLNVETARQQLNLLAKPPRETDVAPLKAQVEQSRQGVGLAEYQLEQSELKAPEDGIVTAITLKKGEIASPALSLITLDSNTNAIKALVSESDIVKLKIGQKVSINFDALDPSREFFGSVQQIYPAETIVQGVVYYEIKIQFDPQGAPVKPGMTANLNLNTAERAGTLLIPTRALQYEGNQTYVEVLHRNDKNEESVEKRNIKIGLQGDENVEVLEGLNENEEVVIFTNAS